MLHVDTLTYAAVLADALSTHCRSAIVISSAHSTHLISIDCTHGAVPSYQ